MVKWSHFPYSENVTETFIETFMKISWKQNFQDFHMLWSSGPPLLTTCGTLQLSVIWCKSGKGHCFLKIRYQNFLTIKAHRFLNILQNCSHIHTTIAFTTTFSILTSTRAIGSSEVKMERRLGPTTNSSLEVALHPLTTASKYQVLSEISQNNCQIIWFQHTRFGPF